MRLKLCFNCETGVTLPFNYNDALVAAVNSALQKSGLSRARNQSQHMYTFSQLYFSAYNICESGITNSGDCVEWFLSSPRIYFLEHLLKGFQQLGAVSVGPVDLYLHDVEVLADPEFTEQMEFSCMSPITVVTRPGLQQVKARYGRINDTGFTDALRRDLVQKYYLIYDSLPTGDDLRITFNKRYIANKKRVSRLIDFQGQRIFGYMVPFVVEGNPELIKVGYQVGFGSNNHYGFGMVKVWHRINGQ
ncbi:MAG: CRISPR-associated endoribonuclease Cas6 [Firmicutes bacterium]|nr:CRISPR-associated endoribonuclease Cas6 [Bacillota bacterium]